MIRWPAVAGLLLMGFAVVQTYVVRDRIGNLEVSPESIRELKERLEQLPTELDEGRFQPSPYELDAEVVRRSGADTFAARGYRGPDGSIYRVYLGGAIRNRESFHAPNYCMPAAGWEIIDQDSVGSPMGEGGDRMRRLHLRKANERMLVYYWFQCGARQTDHDLVARWYRFLDFIAGAFDFGSERRLEPTMIATIYVPFSGTVDIADERARGFMKQIGPELMGAVVAKE